VNAGRFFKSVYRRDVRMIQGGQRLRLSFEARDPVGIFGERVGQYLDGYRAAERRVGRAIDLAHPAFADGRGDFVDANTIARGQRQVGVIIRRVRAQSSAATFGLVAVVLLITGALAIAGPAWRAARIDPAAVLRSK
jgi:hypothetical protein